MFRHSMLSNEGWTTDSAKPCPQLELEPPSGHGRQRENQLGQRDLHRELHVISLRL